MSFEWKKLLLSGLSLCMAAQMTTGLAQAAEYYYDGGEAENVTAYYDGENAGREYFYSGENSGETFHQPTSTDQNSIANNGQIVVGTDGTVAGGTTGNQTSGPLSTIDLPVGEYPEAFDYSTDLDIAGNTVFPNELGPTTQNSNAYVPTFVPTVDSGALATGATYTNPAASYTQSGYTSAAGAVVSGSRGVYAISAPFATYGYGFGFNGYGVTMPVYRAFTPLASRVSYGYGAYNLAAYGNGAYYGLATSQVSMPSITKGGALGRLSIPSIGLNKYVYEGTSQASMRKGIAHFDCTSGWTGNIGLAGHNRGSSASFAKLKDVQIGDTVSYTTAYGTLTYVVSNITTVATTDTSGLLQDGTNKITMYTCKANQPDVKLCVTASLVG